MSRRVRRKPLKRRRVRLDEPELAECVDDNSVDWTKLPDDTALYLFSCLNYRDRASLSSTCRTWRVLGASPCLWQALDIRPHKVDAGAAASLSNRCRSLRKLRFRGAESADSVLFIQARNLREISGDYCRKVGDATLSVMAARHEKLESFQLGPDFCERISSDAIKQLALCCRNLQKLRLSGIRDINADAINALARSCTKLVDIGFIDCLNIDEVSLGNVTSLRLLSIAGTSNMKWGLVLEHWIKLPNLVGLDVSRTDIIPNTITRLFSSSQSLKVLCALHCQALELDVNFTSSSNHKGKVLLALFTDILKGVASLLPDTIKQEKSDTSKQEKNDTCKQEKNDTSKQEKNDTSKQEKNDTSKQEKNAFADWQNSSIKDKKLDEVMNWLEWVLSHSLLRIAESNPQDLDNFWLTQGANILLNLMQSAQEEVQERAATGLATFVVIEDENATIDGRRAESVMRDGGIRLLLNLAKSWREGLQSEAAKAIANLSVNSNVAKAVADEGGIDILAKLARSMNRLVAEEAAGGLWNLSVGEEHKSAIALAGGVRALVDLISKWSNGGEGVLERAAGALANLAADDKCSMEVASVGGVHALATLARTCKADGVQEQAARALANLAAHGDSNTNNAAVGQEPGALEALVHLTQSSHDGVRQEAAGALWNLSFDDRNREQIAVCGGVEALVTLANSCSNSSPALQERAAGALWGLSVSEANSIAIGREGGVAPLISFARSDTEDVHETAAGALWNLAFNPGNALRIVEEGGVQALVGLCSTSLSKMARFMATLALAYMFDGRMDEVASAGTSSEGASKAVSLDGPRRLALKHIDAFILTCADQQAFSAASLSSTPAALAPITEAARIHEAGHLRCSGAEIGRFVTMLRNPSPVLKGCAAFALLQFTVPGGRHGHHHSALMQSAGAPRVLRAAAAAATAPLEAKIFARIVLRNLEHHQTDASI